MKRFNWQIFLGLSLVVFSALLYLFHYAVFGDVHHIFIYLVGDIAFVPIEVLLVTLIIHRLLSEREKRAKLEKLNMVIEAFFNEVGTTLLTYLSDFDPNLDKIRKGLVVTNEWDEQEFLSINRRIKSYDYGVEIKKLDLAGLSKFLQGKRDFLVRLLENPVLMEHESFTELLMAVFHLTAELGYRKEIRQLPNSDYEHLAIDVKRAYTLLVYMWLDYMRHLKDDYPYLFSLAMRTNPFDESASAVVT